MHEYPLTEQIIRTAEKYARQQGASKVSQIHLVVGEDSGCVADCISLYFDLIAKDTLCAQAQLTIKQVKPMLRCNSCGKLFVRKPFHFECPEENCSGEGRPTEIGREFYLESIEIEKNRSNGV
jgi:hydrogenase nickel incorporation protein HypA/HybF